MHTLKQANSPPCALTIAGSDSSAGAGIQADLKTFAALGVYGLSAVTAITAQNTLGVRTIYELPPDLVTQQIDAVMEDLGATVAKTGILSNPAIIEAVVASIHTWRLRVIVDPVMRSSSGTSLLTTSSLLQLHSKLLPVAEVITPNLAEAEMLTGRPVQTLQEMRNAAHEIYTLGPRHVIIKGGHLDGDPVDVYFDGVHSLELRGERITTRHTHGTGCTFSAAITALLARGQSIDDAIIGAKRYITEALRHAPGLGQGNGPMGHFWGKDKDPIK